MEYRRQFWPGAQLVRSFQLALAEGPGSLYRAVIISGAHGIGKTVMVNECEDVAAELGWVTIRANAPQQCKPVWTLITQLCRLACMPDERAGVVITLDELQSVEPDLVHELGTAVQDLMRDRHQVAFVAAGLPLGVDELLENEGASFLRRAVRVELAGLASDARTVFAQTAELGGSTMTPKALGAAVNIARGYPYLMQMIGSLARVQTTLDKSDVIDGDTIAAIRAEAITRLGLQAHKTSLHNPLSREFEFRQNMARLTEKDGLAPIPAITHALGVTPNGISMTRRSLLNRDLVAVPRQKELSFALPYLGEYLRSLPQWAARPQTIRHSNNPAFRRFGPPIFRR